MKSNLPLVMIDEPGSFGPIETWEQFLAEVQAMPDFHGKAGIIDNAERLILQKTEALGARPRSGGKPESCSDD